MARELVINGLNKDDNEYLLNQTPEEETKAKPSFTTNGNVISVGFGK